MNARASANDQALTSILSGADRAGPKIPTKGRNETAAWSKCGNLMAFGGDQNGRRGNLRGFLVSTKAQRGGE